MYRYLTCNVKNSKTTVSSTENSRNERYCFSLLCMNQVPGVSLCKLDEYIIVQQL